MSRQIISIFDRVNVVYEFGRRCQNVGRGIHPRACFLLRLKRQVKSRMKIYIYRSLLDWVESPYIGRSLFALCLAHCSQFEHSGDSTMQSSQCVTVHPVAKFRSCHKAIMVITGRAHCYTF